MRWGVGHRDRTDTLLKNIPESFESYQVYKIDLARAHTNYLVHLAGDTVSYQELEEWMFFDTTFLTSQEYNHFVYAVCGLRSGQKVIIFDTDHNRDLKGEKVFQFSYNRAGIQALRKAPLAFKVDPLTRMDRTLGNELMLNYEMYDGDTIIRCNILVEVQSNYAILLNPTIPKDAKWIDYHFELLTIEHVKAQVEIMDSIYEVSLIPKRMTKYLRCPTFLRNMSHAHSPIMRNYNGGPITVQGYDVSIFPTADGASGMLKVSEDLAISKQPANITQYDYELMDVTTETIFDSSLVKHDLTLLHFFGTWCGPCKRYFPELVELAQQNSNLNVVGCASEWKVNFERLQEVKNDYQLYWKVLVDKYSLQDQNNLANQWGISFYPTYILADGNGDVLINTTNLDKIKKYLEE